MHPRPGSEPRVGLIVLSSDLTPERDLVPALHRAGILTAVSKVRYDNPITPANLRSLGDRLAAAADLLPVSELAPLIAFCCTSASIELGHLRVAKAIGTARAAATVIDTASAVEQELRGLSAKRIALLAPYRRAVTQRVANYLAGLGFEVVASHSLGHDDDRDIAALEPDVIRDWVCNQDTAAAEAVFVSCTSLRALELGPALARSLGRPVVSSNGALFAAITRHFATS